MSKVKVTGNKTKEKTEQKKVSGIVTAVIVTAGVLLIALILILAEALFSGKITIENDTSLDMEAVSIHFDNSNSLAYAYEIEAEPFETEAIINTPVKARSTAKGSFPNMPLYGKDAGMIVVVKVNGEEIDFNCGNFNSNFKGKIKIRFYEEKGAVYIAVKATTGLFNSTANTDCNEIYTLIETE